MKVAGMTVLERIVRQCARQGATDILVRCDVNELPHLASVPAAVRFVALDAPTPADARHVPGDELLGMRVADEPSRRAAEWALLQTCRRPYDGPGDRFVTRAVSLRITRFLAARAVTPNQVTAVASVVGLAACALAAIGTWPLIAVAGLLMFAQVVLDSVDGELARILDRGSRLGMWLDNLSDDVIDNLLVVGLGLGLGGIWATVGIAAAGGRALSAIVTYLGAGAAGSPGDVMAFRWWFERDAHSAEEVYDQPFTLGLALRSLGRRDTYMLVFAGSCLVGVPAVGFALGTVNSVIYFAMAVAHLAARRGRP
jgi:phosphatidylglycerophosphate synthase